MPDKSKEKNYIEFDWTLLCASLKVTFMVLIFTLLIESHKLQVYGVSHVQITNIRQALPTL